MGLRFDPSLSFGSPGPALKSPLPRMDGLPSTAVSNNFDRTYPASTFSPPAMSSSLTSNSSISSASSTGSSSRHHSRSAYGTQSLDYFSAAAVRRTPPASPRVEALGSLPDGAGPRVGGARFNSYPLGRGHVSPYTEGPPSLARNMFSGSSSYSSSVGPGGDLDSPLSQSSTPSMTTSSGGTPSDSPMSPPSFPLGNGYDPSLSMPRAGAQNLGGVSYSDFVNQ